MPSTLAPSAADRINVLRADAELWESVSHERRRDAEMRGTARRVRRHRGVWGAAEDADLVRGGMGLLVLAGTLVRSVGTHDRVAAELLSVGDVLQPDRHDGEEATLPFETTWKVLAPLELALLDREWVHRMAPHPQVSVVLSGRLLVRSRRLASQLAIVHRHRLDERLRLMLWELADRYGRVGRHGVRLELDLTHDLLSRLVGAHRPSVSVALGRLEREGHLTRTSGQWLLPGSPPAPGELAP